MKLYRKIPAEIWTINFHNKAPKGEKWTQRKDAYISSNFHNKALKKGRMNTQKWCVPFVRIAPISNSVSQNLWGIWSYLALTDADCDGLNPAGYGSGRPYEYPLVRRVWRENRYGFNRKTDLEYSVNWRKQEKLIPKSQRSFKTESKQQKIIERRRGRERRTYLENSKGDSDDQSNLQCGASLFFFFFFSPSGVWCEEIASIVVWLGFFLERKKVKKTDVKRVDFSPFSLSLSPYRNIGRFFFFFF